MQNPRRRTCRVRRGRFCADNAAVDNCSRPQPKQNLAIGSIIENANAAHIRTCVRRLVLWANLRFLTRTGEMCGLSSGIIRLDHTTTFALSCRTHHSRSSSSPFNSARRRSMIFCLFFSRRSISRLMLLSSLSSSLTSSFCSLSFSSNN